MSRIDRTIRKREPAPEPRPPATWTTARLKAEYARLGLLARSWKTFKARGEILNVLYARGEDCPE